MPITEIPPTPSTPSSPPPESPLRRHTPGRYGELDPDELFHVIDDLQGSKTRGRIREFIWISIIFHMMLFWYLAYGPRYFHHVRVVEPSVNQHKDFTYLDTPETLRQMKPKVAITKKPTIDQKSLEAMRKAEPPKPQTQPQQPPPPQVTQQQPPPPVAQPQPSNQPALAEAPKPEVKPAPTVPNFNTGPSTPGEAIRQAARAASQSPGIVGGDQGGPGGPNGPIGGGGASIISDTMGVDFNAYLKRIVYDTERAWWPIIPEIARPPLNKQGHVMIRFKIMKDGTLKEMHLEGPSGDVSLDRAAWGGILGAAPFPFLPKDFKGDFIELRFYFLYNTKPGAE